MMKKNKLAKLLLAVIMTVCCISSIIACNNKNFTVTFDSDNGSSVPSITVKSGKTIEKPNDPTKEGYSFEKWVMQDGSDFGFGTTAVKSDITLKAVWTTKKYTVTFDTGTGGPTVESQQINHGGTASRPSANPVKSGEVFDDWYATAQFKDEDRFDFSKPILQATTIYGRFVKEIEKRFTVKFEGSSTPIADRTTTLGGLLEKPLPTPTSATGGAFIGWWFSDFERSDKLTCQYTNQVITQNMTLYAVWQGTAPLVSVTSSRVFWDDMGMSVNYSLTITSPSGTPYSRTISELEYPYDFSTREKGEYKIELAVGDEKTTVYYNNKALSRVSLFDVEGFELQFNSVANADKYLVTVVCGNKEASHVQRHTDYDNGKSTLFNFGQCTMRPLEEGGITFVVKAVATDYVTSESKPHIFERSLSKVTGLDIDPLSEKFVWNNNTLAQYYMVKIGDGTFERVNPVAGALTVTSASVKEYDPGDIKVSVYAVAHGYNHSETAEYTYSKKRLAAPLASSIDLDGNTLIWDSVAGASNGYTIKIDSVEHDCPKNSFELPSGIPSNIEISIKANATDTALESLYSDAKPFSATLEGTVRYENGKVYWSKVFGATKYAVELNGELLDAKKITGTEAEITFKKDKLNIIKVCFYDKDGVASDWTTIEVTVYTVSLMYNLENHNVFRTLYRAKGDDLNLPDGELGGYDFVKWSDEEENGLEYGETTLKNEDNLTLYAYWTSKWFKATYDLDGGGTLPKDTPVEKEIAFKSGRFSLPVPTPSDSIQAFAGWYTEKSGQGDKVTDEKGNSEGVWEYETDKTFYACWVSVFKFELLSSGKEYAVLKGPGIGYVNSVKIPVKYEGLYVTTVEQNAFQSCDKLLTVEIPNTIKLVATSTTSYSGGNGEGSAFYYCANIMNVNVYDAEDPNNKEIKYMSNGGILYAVESGSARLAYFPYARTGECILPRVVGQMLDSDGKTVDVLLTEITTNVLRSTKISKITIPSSVTYVGQYAIANCANLTEIKFLETAQGEEDKPLDLHVGAFLPQNSTAVSTITLPSRLREFNYQNFSGIEGLQNLHIVGSGGQYYSVNGIVYQNKAVSGGNEKTVIYCPRGKTGTVSLDNTTKVIGKNAFANPTHTDFDLKKDPYFYGSKMSTLIIPGSVIRIEENGVRNCWHNLNDVRFLGDANDNDLVIEKAAFYGCSKIAALILPENLKKIAIGAFGVGTYAQLKTVTITASGIETGAYADGAFGTIPEGSTQAVYTVTKVILGDNASLVDITAVFGPTVAEVEVSDTNRNYKTIDGVLYNFGVTTVVFYPSAKEGVFDLTIPELISVSEITANVFKNKTKLEGIIFNAGITMIGASAFEGCTNLLSATFVGTGTELSIGSRAFYDCRKMTFSLPAWTKVIDSEAFYQCYGLTSVTVPGGVRAIGAGAFQSCTGLLEITISEGVEEIGNKAFAGCIKLGSIAFPKSLSKLPLMEAVYNPSDGKLITAEMGLYQLFENCLKLQSITFHPENPNFEARNGIIYGKDKGEVTELLYCASFASGDGGVVDIPKTVSRIWGRAFYKNTAIIEIKFSEGIIGDLEIGPDVFNGCTMLSLITLPKGLKTVKSNVFNGCASLETIVIPNTVTKMEVNAFFGCAALTTIDFEALPAGTEIIEDTADPGYNALVLAEGGYVSTGVLVYLNGGYTSVMHNAGVFVGCTALQNITLPERTLRIPVYAFAEYIYGYTTDRVGEGSSGTDVLVYKYMQGSLTTVHIPSTVKTIGDGAFYNSSTKSTLTTVVFDNIENSQLTAIGTDDSYISVKGAFQYCQNLTTIELPASLRTIGTNAFAGSSSTPGPKLTNFSIHEYKDGDRDVKSQLRSIGNHAFYYSKIKTFNLPESLVEIKECAFQYSGLTSVKIGKNVTTIGGTGTFPYVFGYCTGLKTVEFEEGALELIDRGTFIGCTALEEVVLPASLETLGQEAFSGCKALTSVTFATYPTVDSQGKIADATAEGGKRDATAEEKLRSGKSALTTIGESAFANTGIIADTEATAFRFPESYIFMDINGNVSSPGIKLGQTMFAGSKGLKIVYLPKSIVNVDNVFKKSYVNKMIVATGHKTFSSKGDLPILYNETGLSIMLTFGELSGDKDGLFTIAKGASTIGNSAFENQAILKKIIIPASVTKIGDYAFNNCHNLEEVVFETNVEGDPTQGEAGLLELGAGAFQNCVSLKKINLSRTKIKHVKEYTFMNCFKLDEINLPSTLLAIGLYTGNLDETTLANPVMNGSSSYAFGSCSSLASIEIPNTVVMINGSNNFYRCTVLTNLTLPSSLQILGASTFSNSGIVNIKFQSNVRKMGSSSPFNNAASLETVQFHKDQTSFDSNTTNTSFTALALFGTTNPALKRVFYTDANVAAGESILPDGVTTLAASAFSGTAITKISLPGVTTLGNNTFKDCTQLTEVSLPKWILTSATTATNTFENCENLKTVYLNESTTTGQCMTAISTSTFLNCTSLEFINPAGKVVNPDDNSVTYTEPVNLPAGLTLAFGNNAFKNSGIRSIKIPVGVPNLGTSYSTVTAVFADCARLESVELPANLKQIGARVFQNCVSLKKITYTGYAGYNDTTKKSALPDGMTIIGQYAFSNTGAIDNLTINLASTVVGSSQLGTYIFGPGAAYATAPAIPAGGSSRIKNLVISGAGTYLSASMFEGCASLETVDLSASSITALGNLSNASTFKDCTALTSVKLPGNLVSLGTASGTSYAIFQGCTSLNEIEFPTSFRTIGGDVFRECNGLKKITYAGYSDYNTKGSAFLPAITMIGINAFYNCDITGVINLPASLATLGGSCFTANNNMTKYIIDSSNAKFETDASGMLYDKTTGALMLCPSGYANSLLDLSGTSLTEIGDYVFNGLSQITSVILPSTIKRIGASAFYGCKITEIDLPADLEFIGNYAFCGTSLTNIDLPSKLETIGNYAFYGTKIQTITIPKSVITIGSYAFAYTPLTDFIMEGTGDVTFTASTSSAVATGNTFEGCTSLSNVVLSNGITALSHNMFKGCTALEYIDLPTNLVFMGIASFESSGIKEIVVPKNVVHMGGTKGSKAGTNGAIGTVTNISAVFNNCANLEKVELPAGLDSIGPYAFRNTTSLKTITYTGYNGEGNILPNVTLLGYGVFAGSGIPELTLPETIVSFNGNIFAGQNSSSSYYYSESSTIQEVTVLCDLTSGGQGTASMFMGCESLTTVNLGENVTILHGSSMFRNCKSLTNINIANVTTLGANMFAGCESLSSITLNEAIEALPAGSAASGSNPTLGMFSDCASLESIDLPSNLVFMGTYTFARSGLKNITVPEKVVHLGTEKNAVPSISAAVNVFEDCKDLLSVQLPAGLLSIGSRTFAGCESLTSITTYEPVVEEDGDEDGDDGDVVPAALATEEDEVIPNVLPNVTLIGTYAFAGCGLKEITVPASLATFTGTYMFSESALETVTIASSAMVTFMFYNCKSLVSVIFEGEIATITESSFNGCEALQSIVIPDTVTLIQAGAFAYCTDLQSIIIPANVKVASRAGGATSVPVFAGWTANQTIYVIDSSYTAIGSNGWGVPGSTLPYIWSMDCAAKVVWSYDPLA